MKTIDDIEDQIQKAASTLRKLPRVTVRNRFCNWPDVLRGYYEAYDNESSRDRLVVRLPPTSEAITLMDEALNWLTWVRGTPQKIIWARLSARGEPPGWRWLSRQTGFSEKTVKDCYYRNLQIIAERHNRESK